MVHKIPQYGWIPDLPDARDHLYAAPPPVLAALPSQVDLRPTCPPVLDQGNFGSCTAIANAHVFDQQQHARAAFLPSCLFIYYNERVMEGTVRVDAGTMIRDGIKSIAQQGGCPEQRWPYLLAKFTHKPTKPCYTDAMKHQAVSYQRLMPTLPQLQGCLASGFPFVFGFTVYASFESADVTRTGTVPMPRAAGVFYAALCVPHGRAFSGRFLDRTDCRSVSAACAAAAAAGMRRRRRACAAWWRASARARVVHELVLAQAAGRLTRRAADHRMLAAGEPVRDGGQRAVRETS